jgi:membrane-bound metal-dependent hydrolase YbcI (DUF457 family)
MPLPVAHGLIGASVIAGFYPVVPFKNYCRLLLFGAFLGIFPDFDYLLNWLKVSGGGWHHDFTHSVVFAFLIGIVSASLCGSLNVRNALVFGLAMLSHTMLDFCITESGGVELFWPLSDHRYKIGIPNPIDYTWDNRTLVKGLIDIVKISMIELAVFGPILVITLIMKNRIYGKQPT